MKLWLLTQTATDGWDTYDSVIVAAETEKEAKEIHPQGEKGWESISTWAPGPDRVSARYIGRAANKIKKGVILASFNAG